MSEPVELSIAVLKRIAMQGPQAVAEFAAANGMTVEAVTTALRQASIHGSSAMVRSVAESGLSRVVAAEAAAARAAAAAAEAAVMAEAAAAEALVAAEAVAAAEAAGGTAVAEAVAAAELASANAASAAEACAVASANAARTAAMTAEGIAAANAGTAITAGEGALVTAETAGGTLARVGHSVGRVVVAHVPHILFVLVIGIGLVILAGQIGGMMGDDPVKAGWRNRLGPDRDNDVRTAGPIEETTTGSFLPDLQSKKDSPKGSGELWRQSWSNPSQDVAVRKSGTVIQLSIVEEVAGIAGRVEFLDSRGRSREAPLQVNSSGDGYDISWDSGNGTVQGSLKIDDGNGWLHGTLAMPGQAGGTVRVSLMPQR